MRAPWQKEDKTNTCWLDALPIVQYFFVNTRPCEPSDSLVLVSCVPLQPLLALRGLRPSAGARPWSVCGIFGRPQTMPGSSVPRPCGCGEIGESSKGLMRCRIVLADEPRTGTRWFGTHVGNTQRGGQKTKGFGPCRGDHPFLLLD